MDENPVAGPHAGAVGTVEQTDVDRPPDSRDLDGGEAVRLIDDAKDPTWYGQAHARTLLSGGGPSRPPDKGLSSRRTTCNPRRRGGLLICQMPVPGQRDAVQRSLLRENAYTA